MTTQTATAADLMNTARNVLLEAAEAYKIEDDRHRMLRARSLSREVAAEDPEIQERVWSVLPEHEGGSAVRPDDVAVWAGVSVSLVHPVLEALRGQHRAQMAGGWWRKRDA